MIKRLFCTHTWKTLRKDDYFKQIYGCNNCGKVLEMTEPDAIKWRFKSERKGAKFV